MEVAIVDVLPVKSNVLNQLPDVIVSAEAPALMLRLGAFAAVPPVVPNTTVAVAAWLRVNPPVPVHVNPVAVAIDSTVVAAVVLDRTMLVVPKAIALATVPDVLQIPAVAVNPPRFNVPEVNVSVDVEALVTFSASPSVTVIPVPLTLTPLRVFPAEMRVPVPFRNSEPVQVRVMPATNVTLPATFVFMVPAMVPVNPVKLSVFAPVFPVEIVTVPAPDAASKNTSSAVVGTACPPAPPDVSDHLVPAVPSQAAVPPTQYRKAI